ncbi:rRNA (cytosine-C5-)-methyltransferase nop2, partial [Coemansia sp. RSA 2603]
MGRRAKNKQDVPLPLNQEKATGKVTKGLHDKLKHDATRSRKQNTAALKNKSANSGRHQPAPQKAPAPKKRAPEPVSDEESDDSESGAASDAQSDAASDAEMRDVDDGGWDNAPMESDSDVADDSDEMDDFDSDDDQEEEEATQMPLALLDSDDDEEESDEDDSDEDDSMGGGVESYDEFDTDDEQPVTFRDMEKRSRKLDKQRQHVEATADLELREAGAVVAGERELFVLPSAEQIEAEKETPPDLSQIQLRIQEIIRVLNNFAELRAPEASRLDYMDQLKRD